jgi:ABC-type branched-subunit amino acid transport system permease subunit
VLLGAWSVVCCVPVHHMEAHALMAAMPGVLQHQQQQQQGEAAAAAAQPSMTFPALLLLASGGHNMLVGSVYAAFCVVGFLWVFGLLKGQHNESPLRDDPPLHCCRHGCEDCCQLMGMPMHFDEGECWVLVVCTLRACAPHRGSRSHGRNARRSAAAAAAAGG